MLLLEVVRLRGGVHGRGFGGGVIRRTRSSADGAKIFLSGLEDRLAAGVLEDRPVGVGDNG